MHISVDQNIRYDQENMVCDVDGPATEASQEFSRNHN